LICGSIGPSSMRLIDDLSAAIASSVPRRMRSGGTRR
jgi:hypothetical protein